MQTIPHHVVRQGETRPSAPAHWVKDDGEWTATSWGEYASRVDIAGRALVALDCEVGAVVALLGPSSPAWVILDVAAMAIGAVPAGIYTTSPPDEIESVLRHAEARLLFAGSRPCLDEITPRRDGLPALKHVVLAPGLDRADSDGDGVLTWDELMALADRVPESAVRERMDRLSADQLATLIYTSGTTGRPRGVMLSHGSLAWTAEMLGELTSASPDDTLLSYLPLSHVAEQVTTIHGPAVGGAQVYFAESLDTIAENLREVQPTVMFGVPRIWERFHAVVAERMDTATGVKKGVLSWVRDVSSRYQRAHLNGRHAGPLVWLQHGLADYFLLSKLKPALGLGRARLCASGAAPIDGAVLDFFASLDVPIFEVYGQAETSGRTAINLPGRVRLGSVGQPLPGTEVRIAEDGEILVRGPHVFRGYYRDDEATHDVLQDGWLHSGDLGHLDEDGYLHVTGRKNDIITTAGGKSIAPHELEAALKRHRLVGDAVLVGDRRAYLTALITLDPQALDEGGLGPAARACADPEIRAEVQATVNALNREVAQAERIERFTLLPGSFTVAGGELTPTLAVRRQAVLTKYADIIEAMYATDPPRSS